MDEIIYEIFKVQSDFALEAVTKNQVFYRVFYMQLVWYDQPAQTGF